MLIIIGVIIAAAAGVLTFLILDNRRQKRKEKRLAAARQLIRGKKLDMAIHRSGKGEQISLRKQMIEIAIHNPQKKYVFDPEDGISFGRRSENNICIHDMKVTSMHCRIVSRNGIVCIEDLQSINGTFIQRRLSRISVNSPTALRSGDRLLIGDAEIDMQLFWVDTTFI